MITNDDVPIKSDDYEFDWEVIEIYNVTRRSQERRGALVRYTPCNDIEACSTIEKFVPIPWHKCTGADHARSVCEQKIASYAPRKEWQRELHPAPPDNSTEILKELENGEPAKGSFREGSPADPAGSEGADSVPESGGPEGPRE